MVWKPWYLAAATSEWPVGCISGRHPPFTRIRTPRAGTRNCIFYKHSWLVRHLVPQMRKTGDSLSGKDMDLLRVTEPVLWLDPS